MCLFGEGDYAQVSGPCLLKVVIRKPHVDTNETTCHILTQLRYVDNTVIDLESNIVTVNEKAKAPVEELAAQGETANHLLNDLCKGYKVASNKGFSSYIQKKRDDYSDSTTPMDADTLMYQVSNYYVTSVEAVKSGNISDDEQDPHQAGGNVRGSTHQSN